MSKFNLSGKIAATLADASYDVSTASARRSKSLEERATELAQGNAAFQDVAGEHGDDGIRALSSGSGFRTQEEAGFGVLLERDSLQKGEFIFVARGTVFNRTADWGTNFNIGWTQGPSASNVHQGFMRTYSGLRADLQKMLKSPAVKRVHFIGHSLGGAIASLAALDYAQTPKADGGTHLYTFGAPRIGFSGFGQDLGRSIGVNNVKRVFCLSDPIPNLPVYPFMHQGCGAHLIDDPFWHVTVAAHSMKGFYIPAMPKQGWPPCAPSSFISDPEFFIRKAEAASGIHSKTGLYLLGLALGHLIPLIRTVVGLVIDGVVTLYDQLAEAVRRAAQIGARIGGMVLRFVKAALRFVGQAGWAASVSMGDITAGFLRWLFEMMFAPVRMAANAAISRLF